MARIETATGPVSPDGEYEWFETIQSEDLSKVVTLLGGEAQDDVLTLLKDRYTGDGSYELEKALRNSTIKVETYVA